MADQLLWVDYTRRGDPAREFYVARLKRLLTYVGPFPTGVPRPAELVAALLNVLEEATHAG